MNIADYRNQVLKVLKQTNNRYSSKFHPKSQTVYNRLFI